jgi:hypothetical protein
MLFHLVILWGCLYLHFVDRTAKAHEGTMLAFKCGAQFEPILIPFTIREKIKKKVHLYLACSLMYGLKT